MVRTCEALPTEQVVHGNIHDVQHEDNIHDIQQEALTAIVTARARYSPASSTMVARTYTMVEKDALLLAGGGGMYLPSGVTLANRISMLSRAAGGRHMQLGLIPALLCDMKETADPQQSHKAASMARPA